MPTLFLSRLAAYLMLNLTFKPNEKRRPKKHEERIFTYKDLPCLQPAFYLAKKMGESVGRSKILQR